MASGCFPSFVGQSSIKDLCLPFLQMYDLDGCEIVMALHKYSSIKPIGLHVSLGGFSVLCYRTRGAAISPFVPTCEIPSSPSLETCDYLAQTHTLLVMKFGFTDCKRVAHKHMHTHTQRQTPSLDDLEFVSFSWHVFTAGYFGCSAEWYAATGDPRVMMICFPEQGNLYTPWKMIFLCYGSMSICQELFEFVFSCLKLCSASGAVGHGDHILRWLAPKEQNFKSQKYLSKLNGIKTEPKQDVLTCCSSCLFGGF